MTKPRSPQQHRRFFALINAAFTHWPESFKKFQPDSSEHLRSWLLVKSGHRVIGTFYAPQSDAAGTFAAMIPVVVQTIYRKHVWAWDKDGAIYVCAPKSIAFAELGHNEFCALNDDVDAVLREIGLDPDQLLRETEAAA